MLGVWHGRSLGLPAAAALIGRPEHSVADALEVLVDAQLLQSPAPDWYTFHDLLKAYATDRAVKEEPEPVRSQATQRVLSWYLQSADAVAQMVSPHRFRIPLTATGEASDAPQFDPMQFRTPEQALNWCEIERANLVMATRQAAEIGLHEFAWQIPVASLAFFNRRTYWADWIETHQIALGSARLVGNRQAEAGVLNSLGQAYARQGTDEAVMCFEQALAISRDISDRSEEAHSANNLADAYLRLNRFDEALDLLKRALAIHRNALNLYGEGVALNNMGETYLALDKLDEAIASLEQAESLFASIEETRGEGYALNNLGEAYLRLGHSEEAIDRFSRALALRRGLGDRLGEAQTVASLAEAHIAAKQPGQARALLAAAQGIFEELHDQARVSAIRAQLRELGEPGGEEETFDPAPG
jgi:tetratricopeptide (TPR) repeat protein